MHDRDIADLDEFVIAHGEEGFDVKGSTRAIDTIDAS